VVSTQSTTRYRDGIFFFFFFFLFLGHQNLCIPISTMTDRDMQ
jgi:hypothetical protein